MPHVFFPEDEIQKMIAGGMTEKQIVDKWVETINKIAQAKLDAENKEAGLDNAA